MIVSEYFIEETVTVDNLEVISSGVLHCKDRITLQLKNGKNEKFKVVIIFKDDYSDAYFEVEGTDDGCIIFMYDHHKPMGVWKPILIGELYGKDIFLMYSIPLIIDGKKIFNYTILKQTY